MLAVGSRPVRVLIVAHEKKTARCDLVRGRQNIFNLLAAMAFAGALRSLLR
jgi:hypothetical protein